MLKKKYNLYKQLFTKHNYRKKYLTLLLVKSLAHNHLLSPLNRISFLSQPDYFDNIFHKFSCFQKLHCLVTLSPKVSNREYFYSRFFLNKQLEKLVVSNTLK
jgi:hypothetical protein